MKRTRGENVNLTKNAVGDIDDASVFPEGEHVPTVQKPKFQGLRKEILKAVFNERLV